MTTRPDYLSFTFPISVVYHNSMIDFADSFLSSCGLHVGQFSTPKNFYSYSYSIENRFGLDVGYVSWGGNGNTINYVFSGSAFSDMSRVSLMFIRDYISLMSAKITRLDLCIDLYDHDFDSEWAIARDGGYDFPQAFFDGGRSERKLRLIDDCGSGDGCTGYIGSRDGLTYTRIYEKGLQLGHLNSRWVRVETEFRNAHIPADAIFNSDTYFAAVSLRHAELVNVLIDKKMPRIKPRKKSIVDSTASIIEHIRNSYGQHINVLRGCYSDSDLLDLLQRDGIPKRLRKL